MHRFTVVRQPSKYVDDPHLVLLIDGVPFDVYLARAAGDPTIEGLVTTLDGCLYDPGDQELVARTVLPMGPASELLPVLVCPDDCDFSCSVVVTEVEHTLQGVCWTRVGLAGGATGPHRFESIRWFEGVGPFQWSHDEYQRFLASCRELARPWWT